MQWKHTKEGKNEVKPEWNEKTTNSKCKSIWTVQPKEAAEDQRDFWQAKVLS